MSTPIEQAAKAIYELGGSDAWDVQHEYVRQQAREDARAVFESIDPDELARVIGAVSWHPSAAETRPDVAHAIAAAVKAYLKGEEA